MAPFTPTPHRAPTPGPSAGGSVVAGVGYTCSVGVGLWGLAGMMHWMSTPVAPPMLMMGSGAIWVVAAAWDHLRTPRRVGVRAAQAYPPAADLPGGFVTGPVTPRGTVTMDVAAALRPAGPAPALPAAPVALSAPRLAVPIAPVERTRPSPVPSSIRPTLDLPAVAPAASIRPPSTPTRPVPNGPDTIVLTMATVAQLPSLVAHRVRQQWNTVAVRSPADPAWITAPGQYAVLPAR